MRRMHACDSVHQTHESTYMVGVVTRVRIFESAHLEDSYVGDLL